MTGRPLLPDTAALLETLAGAGLTVGVAESLTGGLLAAAVVDVPGSSRVFRGGVVSYATDLKASVLGVDAALLAAGGPVQAEVAIQMAEGARRVLGADIGVATTGVAGPGPQDGKPAGTVFVGLAGPAGTEVRELALEGGRREVREGAVAAALTLLEQYATTTVAVG